jgi:hypothetical protein
MYNIRDNIMMFFGKKKHNINGGLKKKKNHTIKPALVW